MAVYGMMRNFPISGLAQANVALRFTPVFNGRFADAIALLKPLLDLDPDDVEFLFPDSTGVGGPLLAPARRSEAIPRISDH